MSKQRDDFFKRNQAAQIAAMQMQDVPIMPRIMTTEELRDKFAMFAMQAIISSGSDAPLAALAELAYAQADAMIAEKIRQSREAKGDV